MAKDKRADDFLFDNRIVQRNIRENRVDRKDYDKFLTSLPDLEGKFEDIGEQIYKAKKPGLSISSEVNRLESEDE